MKVIAPPDDTPEDEQYYGLVVSKDELQILRDILGESSASCVHATPLFEALDDLVVDEVYKIVRDGKRIGPYIVEEI